METPHALIVEDTPELAEIFALALMAAGYQTQVLDNGQSARQFLATESPDLLLLDIHLPHYSGDRLLEEVRQLPHLAQTLVILATADTRRGEELRDVADFVLQKPISFAQLRDLSSRLTAAMPRLRHDPSDTLSC
jgi:DNA-binding response OmpR family regulator